MVVKVKAHRRSGGRVKVHSYVRSSPHVDDLKFKAGDKVKKKTMKKKSSNLRGMARGLDFPDKRDLAGSNPVEFKVIVPSTKDFSKALTKREFEERIGETAGFLTGLFGGSTVTEGRGTYEYKGEIISEDVAVLTVNAKKKDYLKYDVLLEDWLKEKKKAWGQDSMGFEYQGKLIFV